MSWFTELAGKAESLLEKVDTVAASALTKEQSSNEGMGSFSRGTTSSVVSDPSPAVTQKTAASYSNHTDIPRAGSENSVIGEKKKI